MGGWVGVLLVGFAGQQVEVVECASVQPPLPSHSRPPMVCLPAPKPPDLSLSAVYAKGERVGEFGIVHPEVLAAFDIPFPVSALEINLEPFCFDQFYQPLSTHGHGF